MIQPEKYNFDPADVELSKMARSMAHPVRIMILRELASSGSAMGTNEIKELPMSPSTVIQHLRDLKKSGLIKGKIFGANACFWLDVESFKKVTACWRTLDELFDKSQQGQ